MYSTFNTVEEFYNITRSIYNTDPKLNPKQFVRKLQELQLVIDDLVDYYGEH